MSNKSFFRGAVLSALFLSLALSLGGCKSIGDIKKGDDLDRALKGYEAAMRWSDYSSMLTYHNFPEDDPVPLPEDFQALRVMQYEVIYPPVSREDGSTQQMVEISYINQDYQIVRKVKDPQIWVHNEDVGRWEITSPVPLPSAAPAE